MLLVMLYILSLELKIASLTIFLSYFNFYLFTLFTLLCNVDIKFLN